MDDVTIEAAESDEAETITSLWVRLADGQRAYGSHILPEANRTQIRESVARHIVGNTLLVARRDGIVGFVMFTVEDGTYEQDLDRGIVENIYVDPAARNEGVGTALLRAAERRLAERGADTVALEVMAGNDAARRFYDRQGYEPNRLELEKRVESDTHSKDDE